MEYQSSGRPQRPKGTSIKQALKVVLVLAVCAWLVYQIKNSRIKTENNGGQTKLVAGYGAISLGRKGIPSRLDERALPDAGNVDSVGEAKESSGGSDGAKEDKAEEELGHIYEKLRTSEGKEVELKPESQPRASSKIKYKDSSKEKSGKVHIESRRSESGHKEHGNDKEKEVQLRELPNDGQVRKNAKSNFSVKENDEDEDPRINEKKTRMQKNVVEYAGVTEEIDGVQSFHDENGVPPDGNEIEVVVGQAHILQENISNVSKGSWLEKINIYEVTSVEDSDVEVNLLGSKNAVTADEEINMGTFTHVDTSGIKRNSEIGEGDNLDL